MTGFYKKSSKPNDKTRWQSPFHSVVATAPVVLYPHGAVRNRRLILLLSRNKLHFGLFKFNDSEVPDRRPGWGIVRRRGFVESEDFLSVNCSDIGIEFSEFRLKDLKEIIIWSMLISISIKQISRPI